MEAEAVDFYDLDADLTDAQRALRDRVRDWVEARFMPMLGEYWRDGTFPRHLLPEMAALGCFGSTIQGYGCPGHSPLEHGIISRELERGDSSLRTFASVQGSLAMHAIHDFGSDEQKDRWLPALARAQKVACFGLTEPGTGSNPAGLETRARRTEGGYVLDGRKTWINHADLADVAIIWARLVDEPGVDTESPRAIRGFLVEREGNPGYRPQVIEGKLSLRIGTTCSIDLDACKAEILPGTRGLKSALACLNHARYTIAWGAVGSAMACYDEARRHTLERIQFGHPLAAFQLVQERLARMLISVTRAQLVASRLAELAATGRATPARVSLAKMDNVDAAIEVARSARDLLGAEGILDSVQCFRHMCNLESVRTYEGTANMHLLVLGRDITGLSAFSPQDARTGTPQQPRRTD